MLQPRIALRPSTLAFAAKFGAVGARGQPQFAASFGRHVVEDRQAYGRRQIQADAIEMLGRHLGKTLADVETFDPATLGVDRINVIPGRQMGTQRLVSKLTAIGESRARIAEAVGFRAVKADGAFRPRGDWAAQPTDPIVLKLFIQVGAGQRNQRACRRARLIVQAGERADRPSGPRCDGARSAAWSPSLLRCFHRAS